MCGTTEPNVDGVFLLLLTALLLTNHLSELDTVEEHWISGVLMLFTNQ